MLRRVGVRLVDLPVALFDAAEQHTSDLLREIALVAAANPDLGEEHLYAELLSVADAYAHRPASVRERIVASVALARRHGWDHVTVDVDVDAIGADAALAWEELLQRFDALSRGERLLTLPADPDVAAYRAWYVRELVEQVRTGRAPVSWQRARERDLAGAGRPSGYDV